MGNADHLLRTSSAAGNNLVVQMVLARYANAEHECWPGLDRLAEESRCGKSTVQRAIAWLVEHEGLEVITNGGPENPNPRADPTNLYRLPEHWFVPARLSGGQNDHERNSNAVCVSRDTRNTNQVPIDNTNSKQYPSVVKMTTATDGQNDHCSENNHECPACGRPIQPPKTTCSQLCSAVWIGIPGAKEELERELERRQLLAAL